MNIKLDALGVIFRSDRNFMKRDNISASITMDGPNEARYYNVAYIRRVTINHALGYVPFFRVFYEPFRDGKLFPVINDSDWALANPINSFGGANAGPVMSAEADENNLVLTLIYPDATLASAKFPVHYVLYKDYGLGA